jgi:hypothetical protein
MCKREPISISNFDFMCTYIFFFFDFICTLCINILVSSTLLKFCSYVLGAVFLQLCQLLSLGQHPTIVKPVDPSLYIPRFAESKNLL